MDVDNKRLSLMFYNYLCDVIGSEEVVRTRRGILSACENGTNFCMNIMMSGSKAEGLNLKGSDLDIMIFRNWFPVYETHSDISYPHDYWPMIMDSGDTKPGFTKLKAYDKTLINPFFKKMKGDYYFCSKLFREFYLGFQGCITHGPCLSFVNHNEEPLVDVAFSLRCSKWILQAQPWLTRLRYSWATDEVLKQIVNFGVLLVPIGSKNSPTKDIEWRISFSAAEKLLIWSFNHVQLLCYALMKILLNDVIKKKHDDLLCSYFLKTIMFWICEESLKCEWRSENILSCFMSCLKRLVYCVEYKTCLHYFIPVNNFFEDRFDVEEHRSLVLTLNDLLRSGWTCLLNTDTLSSFHRFLVPSHSQKILTVSYISDIAFNAILLRAFSVFSSNENHFKERIYSALQNGKCKDLYIYNLSWKCQHYADENLGKMSHKLTNKERYDCYRRSLFYLLLGTNHDAVSGWLLLASFFYTNKQYLICEHLLSHCLSECTEEKYLCSRDENMSGEHRFNMYQKTHRLSMLTACKTFSLISEIMFLKHSSILADEFKVNMEFGFIKIFDTLKFAHILDRALRRRNR